MVHLFLISAYAGCSGEFSLVLIEDLHSAMEILINICRNADGLLALRKAETYPYILNAMVIISISIHAIYLIRHEDNRGWWYWK